MGLDAGTTSAKLVAVDRQGTVVSSASSDPITTATPSPGASVQRAVDIWTALATACRRGVEATGPAVRIRAVAMAAQSGSVIPITGPTEPGAAETTGTTGPEAITWMDTRSQSLVDSWDDATKGSIHGISGWGPSPGLGLSTIAWLRSGNHPGCEPSHWASVDDFLVHRLTGSWITNPSNAAGMQLMGVSTRRWSSELCAIAGIDSTALSELRPSGDEAGSLTSQAAAETALPSGTTVVVGGHDQACAALGLGVVEPGSAVLSMGTAWVLTTVAGRADTSSVPHRFSLSPHVVPRRWSISHNLGGLGAALAWALAAVPVDAERLDAELDARNDDTDAGFFLPTIDDKERTSWGRFTGGRSADGSARVDTAGDRDPDDPIERVRAVMEACAFEARRATEAAAATGPVRDLTVIGGGTRSRHLLQRLANTLGLPLTVRPEASWPALGAAALAARAVGWPAASDPLLPADTIRPRPNRDATIDRRHDEYRRLTAGARR